MKKRYLLTFLFLLFFNINVSYAASEFKIVDTGNNTSEFQTLYNNVCTTTYCYARCTRNGYQCTGSPYSPDKEGCIMNGTAESFNSCNGAKDIDYFVLTGDIYDFKKQLKKATCGDGTCWDYIAKTYCEDYKTKNVTKNSEDYKKTCEDVELYYAEGLSNLIDQTNPTKLNCDALFHSGQASEELYKMLKAVITIIKFGIPIALIILGFLDFIKAIFAGAEDQMKKAQSKFIKRIIIGVCIFLVPTLLTFILKVASTVWPNISYDFCGLL